MVETSRPTEEHSLTKLRKNQMKVYQSPKTLPLPINQNSLIAYEDRYCRLRMAIEQNHAERWLISACPPNWKVNVRIHASVSQGEALQMISRYYASLVQQIQATAGTDCHGVVWSASHILDRQRSKFWKFKLFFCLDKSCQLRKVAKQLASEYLGSTHHAAASRIDELESDFRALCNSGKTSDAIQAANQALVH